MNKTYKFYVIQLELGFKSIMQTFDRFDNLNHTTLVDYYATKEDAYKNVEFHADTILTSKQNRNKNITVVIGGC